jgi:hypothetical protein
LDVEIHWAVLVVNKGNACHVEGRDYDVSVEGWNLKVRGKVISNTVGPV